MAKIKFVTKPGKHHPTEAEHAAILHAYAMTLTRDMVRKDLVKLRSRILGSDIAASRSTSWATALTEAIKLLET